MNIDEKIIKLLIASGNVSEEKVEQARKLAESLVWDGEVRPTQRAPDLKPACPTCKDTGSVEYPCPNCRPSKTASSG